MNPQRYRESAKKAKHYSRKKYRNKLLKVLDGI